MEMWVEIGVAGLVKECIRVLGESGLDYTFVKGGTDLAENVKEVAEFARAVGIWSQVIVFGAELATREVFEAVFESVKASTGEIEFVVPAFKDGYSSFVKRVWGARGTEGGASVGDVVRVGVGRGDGDDVWVGIERVLVCREEGWSEEWKGVVGIRRVVLVKHTYN